MTPLLRKSNLSMHIVTSVAWIGAVAAFLVIAVFGQGVDDVRTLRGIAIGLQWIGWYAIVPLCGVSFVTGIIQSLGTPWGLLRHYWVSIKLLITLAATAALIFHLQPIDRLALVAGQASPALPQLAMILAQLVVDAGAALAVLIATATLSVFKPAGLTPRGWAARAAR